MSKLLAVLLCVSLVLGGVSPALAQSAPTGNDGDTPVHRVFLPSVSSASLPDSIQSSPFDDFSKAVALLRPYMRITPNGIPYLTIDRDSALALGVAPQTFDAIYGSMEEVAIAVHDLPWSQQPVVRYANGQWQFSIPETETSAASLCVPIPKWALQAYAWFVIVAGGGTAAIGGFVDATILGLPAGAVLNALGIALSTTGFAFLWWVDNFYPAEGRVVCVF